MTYELIPQPHSRNVEVRINGWTVAKIDEMLIDLLVMQRATNSEPIPWLEAVSRPRKDVWAANI